MDNEMKIVTRQETFNDLAVRELAKNRAACICRLQFKRCSKSSCSNCPIGKRYNNCVAQMSDYDILRLQSYVSEKYLEYSRYPEQWYSHKRYIHYYIMIGLLVFVILFGFSGMMIGLASVPHDSLPFVYDKEVTAVIKHVQERVCDLDGDGKVDCCDYTILFKLTWDSFYPKLRNNCSIVRNYNPGKMNHLFISINNRFIEPRTDNPYFYFIEDIWGTLYDPRCNRYGETKKWLSTIK